MKTPDRVDLHELRPWPRGVHFENARTERVIENLLPPRLVIDAIGSSGKACVEARFAEGEIERRLGLVQR